MSSNFDENDVPQSLQKLNITRMGRANQKFLIEYEFQDTDGQPLPVQVYFDVKQEFFDTLEEFQKKASKRLQLSPETIQRTMKALSSDEHCRRILAYYDRDKDSSDVNSNDMNSAEIGEPKPDTDNDTISEEQEQAYASSSSDPDYTDEGLKLLTVSQAIRKDPMRLRVTGMIVTVRKLFKLTKIVYFTCTQAKCRRSGKSEKVVLDRPIYSLADMPIAFHGGVDEFIRHLRCPVCGSERELRQDNRKFENVKVIELKNVPSSGISSALAANSTLSTEELTVLVVGKHTLSVGIGEEAEIVGDENVLPSTMVSSRFHGQGGGGGVNIRTAGENGRAQPVLYANRMKYTKRKGQLILEPRDREAIKRFASFPNLISRLVSMMCPQYYGEDNAKLSLLLTSARAAPIRKTSFYNREWTNVLFAGDKGTAKTPMAEDSTELIPGSQKASGQHSTGKGIVAIAEKEGSGGAILRTGVASLANDANLFIDEAQLMHFEDQDQFLALMETDHYDFNKLGIRQRIYAKTSHILTANPQGGSWQDPNNMSLDEVLIKEQVKDRIDFFWLFRKPYGKDAIEKYGDNKLRLARKHVRQDRHLLYLFLRKYFYYIRTSPELQELKFSEPYNEDLLTDFWKDLAKTFPDVVGNRTYDTIFRTASEFSRLMLKPAIDSEVIEETKKYLRNMYKQFGKAISETADKRETAYNAICKEIKEHSLRQQWAEQYGPEGTQIADISYSQVHELIIRKYENVNKYLDDNSNGRLSWAARNMRRMLRDRQNEDYDGGKIKVTPTDPHAELTLRWIPNVNTNNTVEHSSKENDNRN